MTIPIRTLLCAAALTLGACADGSDPVAPVAGGSLALAVDAAPAARMPIRGRADVVLRGEVRRLGPKGGVAVVTFEGTTDEGKSIRGGGVLQFQGQLLAEGGAFRLDGADLRFLAVIEEVQVPSAASPSAASLIVRGTGKLRFPGLQVDGLEFELPPTGMGFQGQSQEGTGI